MPILHGNVRRRAASAGNANSVWRMRAGNASSPRSLPTPITTLLGPKKPDHRWHPSETAELEAGTIGIRGTSVGQGVHASDAGECALHHDVGNRSSQGAAELVAV